MPLTENTVTLSATGGTSLPLAGQVAVTASATVSNSSSSTNATLAALVAQITAMQGIFDSLKAEVATAKAKSITDRAAFVKQYNALAKKWNTKNPKSKVALIK
jgi:uncharacterized protein (DUF1501 family)